MFSRVNPTGRIPKTIPETPLSTTMWRQNRLKRGTDHISQTARRDEKKEESSDKHGRGKLNTAELPRKSGCDSLQPCPLPCSGGSVFQVRLPWSEICRSGCCRLIGLTCTGSLSFCTLSRMPSLTGRARQSFGHVRVTALAAWYNATWKQQVLSRVYE